MVELTRMIERLTKHLEVVTLHLHQVETCESTGLNKQMENVVRKVTDKDSYFEVDKSNKVA